MRKKRIDWRAHLLAEELLQARLAARLSQDELAARVCLSRQSLDKLERGVTQTSLVQFREIADALSVPLAQLLAPYLNDPTK